MAMVDRTMIDSILASRTVDGNALRTLTGRVSLGSGDEGDADDFNRSDYSVDTPFPQYASKQFYKYNKGYPKSYGVSDGAQDRAISEDPTDPNAFNQSRSCGSFSDPGDSYGGREYTDGITA